MLNYPGKRMVLKSLISENGIPFMAVEVEKDYNTSDNKLCVVRELDTLIVDLNGNGRLEERMLARTARVGVPPRPPVLLPFRKGWFDTGLVEEPIITELIAEFLEPVQDLLNDGLRDYFLLRRSGKIFALGLPRSTNRGWLREQLQAKHRRKRGRRAHLKRS